MSDHNRFGDRSNTGPKSASKKRTRHIDLREQLCNDGQVGPIEAVSLPLEMITSLRGILLDLDPNLFFPSRSRSRQPMSADWFFDEIIRPVLVRDPVLDKAEVRESGRGLHVILWFEQPVVFASDGERQRWAAIVKVIQRLLPTDPDCPGITALTRPGGSINSKNNTEVARLRKPINVSAAEVLDLYERVRNRPFRTLARLLFGSDHPHPCPVCNASDSKLDALDHIGQCYGHCGKVRLAQLYDAFLALRSSRNSA